MRYLESAAGAALRRHRGSKFTKKRWRCYQRQLAHEMIGHGLIQSISKPARKLRIGLIVGT
jgi:hypothetical protein